MTSDWRPDVWDVIVVGAGMAGLTCARALAEQGVKVLVLEARDGVGGRIKTVPVEGSEAVELGAEFVHGQPAELMALIAEAGCEVYERMGSQVCSEGGVLKECGEERNEAFEVLERLEEFSGKDMSFIDYLDRVGVEGEVRGAAIGYVEGFNAADASLASVLALGAQQAAEDATGGARVYKVRDGYCRLPEYLAERIRAMGGEVRTGARVTGLTWERGRVEVATTGGDVMSRKVVVTLPLGVLLEGSVVMAPEPVAVMRAAALMRMGDVCRFTVLFRTRLWERLRPQPALREMSFLFTPSDLPPVWWTQHPEPSNSLTGWVGGSRAMALLGRDADDLGSMSCTVLARIFGVSEELVRGEMIRCYSHDWTADEYSRGSYSYVGVGGVEASRVMGEPVESTLFFAGEHTDVTGHWGTVHGAMRSGLRAAEQVAAR